LDIALGVGWWESVGYVDAVGDFVQLVDPAVAAKWGPSVGWFQVRTLVAPTAWGAADRVRDIGFLAGRAPGTQQAPDAATVEAAAIAQAKAALTIRNGRDWTLWSVYNSGAYRGHLGVDYPLQLGHLQAPRWNLGGTR
jgi:hypothetical protein